MSDVIMLAEMRQMVNLGTYKALLRISSFPSADLRMMFLILHAEIEDPPTLFMALRLIGWIVLKSNLNRKMWIVTPIFGF